MDPLLSILAVLAGGGLATAVLKYLSDRRRQPLADAHDTVSLQQDVIQAFRESNTLHIEDTKTIRAQAATITALTQTNTALTQANASYVDKIDGLPKRVAELTAQALVQQGFILEQSNALAQAGVSKADQPVQPVEIPLTELTPSTLLSDLAAEQRAEGSGGANQKPPIEKGATDVPKPE